MPTEPKSDAPPPIPDEPAERHEPVTTKAPPPGRKFPCTQCGARLDYDPGVRSLKCPYCGHAEAIEPTGESVEEHDLEEYLAREAEQGGAVIEGRSCEVRCTGCGAVVLLEDRVVTDACPYCFTHLENKPEAAHAMIQPESLLPFGIDNRGALVAFHLWLRSLWFAPSSLSPMANLGKLVGVYVPFWTYDAMTVSRYEGMRGDHYTVKVGKHTHRRTSWRYVSGEVRHFFDDVLICATNSLPPHLVEKLSGWSLHKLEPFQPAYLSGFQTERYAVGLSEGFDRAKAVMAEHIETLCREDIGGDEQRIHWIRTRHSGLTFKHILLPVYVAQYRYFDKTYRILIDGHSGRVVGERPWSWFKILRLVFLILAVVGIIWYIVWRLDQPESPPPGFGMRGAQAAEVVRAEAGELHVRSGSPDPDRGRTGGLPLRVGDLRSAGVSRSGDHDAAEGKHGTTGVWLFSPKASDAIARGRSRGEHTLGMRRAKRSTPEGLYKISFIQPLRG